MRNRENTKAGCAAALIGLLAVASAQAATVRVETRTGEAIQEAIDCVAQQGGGRVVVPAGTYPSGTLQLRSNVDLHLEKGAVVQGPGDGHDLQCFPSSLTKASMGRGLVRAWNVTNVTISGEGDFDARGRECFDTSAADLWGRFFHPRQGAVRSKIVQMYKCRNVTFRGVGFLNSSEWTMRMRRCEDVLFDGIRVINDLRFINADGIDVDGCKRMTIRNSRFLTGDDCLAILATRTSPECEPIATEDLLVENCDLESACQCIRLGCPSEDTIRRAVFRNVRMRGYNGVYFDYSERYLTDFDEGYADISDIRFENFSGSLENSALQIVTAPGVKLRGVRNVLFKDFDVMSKEPLRFVGNVFTPYERIRMENFTFNGERLPDGEVKADRSNDAPLKRVRYVAPQPRDAK